MIKAGMSAVEAIAQLTRGFIKIMGRKPDGLEKIKIQQEAVQRLKNLEKVVDMQGRFLDPSKTIMGGTQEGAALRSGIMKATGAKPKKIDPDKKAEGGRIGLKAGMTRRAFMKLMGAAGAGIGALKTGLLGLGKQAPEAIEAATQTVKEAPNYFFALVDKIRKLGKQSKIGPQERVNEYSYTGKNGDEYTMMEDITSGDIQITKDKMGGVTMGDEMVEGITDRSVMEYKSGQMGEEGLAARMPDEYDEYKIDFDPEGGIADADNISESVRKEIIEEATKKAPSIKKAGGGIATMLGE